MHIHKRQELGPSFRCRFCGHPTQSRRTLQTHSLAKHPGTKKGLHRWDGIPAFTRSMCRAKPKVEVKLLPEQKMKKLPEQKMKNRKKIRPTYADPNQGEKSAKSFIHLCDRLEFKSCMTRIKVCLPPDNYLGC